jgi:hypothetical protein
MFAGTALAAALAAAAVGVFAAESSCEILGLLVDIWRLVNV